MCCRLTSALVLQDASYWLDCSLCRHPTHKQPPQTTVAHLGKVGTRRRLSNSLSGVATGIHSTDQRWAVCIRHGEQQRVGGRHALAVHHCQRRSAVSCAGGKTGDGAVDAGACGGDTAPTAGGGAQPDIIQADRAASGGRVEQHTGGGGRGGVRRGNDWRPARRNGRGQQCANCDELST